MGGKSREKAFENVFGSNENNNKSIFDYEEWQLARLVYDVACDEIPPEDLDDDPTDNAVDECDRVSFDKKVEAAMENFEHVVELFKLSYVAKNTFLESFPKWSSFRETNVQHLKEIAEEIQTDKFNCDISKVVGSVVGAVGGAVALLSFLTPLAAVTLPLAITGGVVSIAGGGVVVGTTVTEIALLKNKLEKTKDLLDEDKKKFSVIAQWFTHTKNLKIALESLIRYDLLKEISKDLQRFLNKMKDETNIRVGSLKDELKNVLTLSIGKMRMSSKIIDLFGHVFSPVVMTFIIVVCLMRNENRHVLGCMMQTERLVVNFLSVLDIAAGTGGLAFGLATRGATAIGRAAVAAMGTFIAIGAVIDVINVVLSSIDLHNRPETESAKQIKKAAGELEKEFSFIKSVYDELKEWKSFDRKNVTNWKTFEIHHVPDDATQVDIKMGVKIHLPEENWGCIILQRSSTINNNCLVHVPATNSQKISRLSRITVKDRSCLVTQWSRWITVIILHVPDDAGEEDIKLAIAPYLPEAGLEGIILQKLSTAGNNWLVKVLNSHSRNLLRQSRIIIKGERCIVTQ